MKICILTTSYPRYEGDYAGNFVHNLAKELVKNKLKVTVVAPHDTDTKDYEVLDGIEIYRFKYWFTKRGQKVAYSGGMPYNLSHSFFAKFQLMLFMVCFFFKGLQNAKKCDIIHAQFLFSGFVGVFIKKLTGKKLVITVHGSDIYTIPKRGLLKQIYIRVLSHSDCFITVSTANRKKLIDLGLRRNIIFVIPNGISLSMFDQMSTLYREENKNIIMWTGRMIEVKGLEYLIQAMKMVVNRYPNSYLMLIGDGPIKHKLIELATTLSLNENVTFVGNVPNNSVPRYLHHADIFVLPSLSEGLPVSLLEAMAAGKPVIASNVGGISDLIKDGINGFLVESKDAEQIAKKINYLLEHPAERIRMGLESKKLVEENFTWDKIAEKTIEIYRNIL